jgi:GT2 family glycosyltransferase
MGFRKKLRIGLGKLLRPPKSDLPAADLPVTDFAPAAPRPAASALCVIDSVISNGKGAAAIIGWLYEPPGGSVQLHMRHAGSRLPLRPFLARVARPDVSEHLAKTYGISVEDKVGFMAIIDVPKRLDASGVVFEVTLPDGEVTAAPKASVRDAAPAIEPDIRELFDFAARAESSTIFNTLGPFIDSIWSSRDRSIEVEEVQYGSPPPNPSVTVIVPLYGRTDFCEYQLLAFSQDPGFAGVDLIYVLDDPRLLDAMKRDAGYWHYLHRVPFRCLYNSRNSGYAAANNIAVKCARSPTLLLLNSDVIPTYSGWLSRLRETLGSIDRAGIMSPVLNYPDGSLQYAGIEFRLAREGPPYFWNKHPWRGLTNPYPRHTPIELDAATGACLLINRALFDQVGGLDDGFILGDFEDSDLSLKVRELGYSIWCDPAVELVHLERQSFVTVGNELWRRSLTYHNAWRHHVRWSDRILSGRGPNV